MKKEVGTWELKELGFDNIHEYFSYIIDSITNGQHKQARILWFDLSKEQRNQFLDWKETYAPAASIRTIIT
jgi:hypothetical protein